MRKINLNLIIILAFVFMISFVSADSMLQWNSQPNMLYNLGDVVSTSATVSGTNFSAFLICNDIVQNTQFPTFNNLLLTNFTVPLQFRVTPNSVGGYTGACQIRGILDGATFYTSQFQISNAVNVTVSSSEKEFQPGNQISLSGTAIKQNGQNINGVTNINISFGNGSIYQNSAPVNNGNFYFNITLPQNAAAGQYLVDIIASELDSSNQITNTGYTSFNILIDQVPTSLNLVPQSDQSIMPGQTYSIKAILYDQTGEKIDSAVNFTIKNSQGEVMDQETTRTDSVLDVPISYNDLPNSWSISATSMGLNSQSNFIVLKNATVSATLTNRTLLVTNIGNVPYNNQILVKLGNQSVLFNVSLDVGQSQKYILSAPNGDYSIEVLNSEGNNLFNGDVSLTGEAVNVQQASKNVLSFLQYPWVWVVVLLILVFVIFFLFRRSHKKRFSKRIDLNRKFRLKDGIVVSGRNNVASSRDRMVKSRNVADFSPSIQGEKQSSSIVCINIKNFEEVRSGKGGIMETMNRLKYIADESKAVVYENGSYFFFIFAPVRTKTLNNELVAIENAEQIKRILDDHNRLLKQKIDFGISINYGMIIAKQGINGLKFMSLGNLISIAKKLASLSKGEIVLSKEVRNRVATDVKTDKQSSGDLEFYPLIEVRNREKSQRFIKEFMSKMEKEEQESNKKFF